MSQRFRLIDTNTTGIPRENGTFNINGPSLMRAPDWIENPLGRYYLYFAHHAGHHIRMAYSDDLYGDWTVYDGGVLHLDETPCVGHIASPDVHVMDGEIRMYFHGPIPPEQDTMSDLKIQYPIVGHQRTFIALSLDGLHFSMVHEQVLGSSYFRVWQWRDQWYALGMPGIFYRSTDDGLTFEVGEQLFSDNCRHTAIALDGNILTVYYTLVGDNPERILLSQVDLSAGWGHWQVTPPTDVLRPIEAWEGAQEPLEPSVRGLAIHPVNQLRDPAIYEEDGNRYLLYSFAGEQGIGITRLDNVE